MKKYILCICALAVSFFATAQIDRTQQPKPGPAPTINLQDPNTFELKNGLKVLVVENNKLPRVSIQLTIDNPLIVEGDKAGTAGLVASLLGKGSQSISKDDYFEEVDFLGANINFGSQSGFAAGLSKYFPRLIELLADGGINPNFTQEEFDKEQNIAIEGIKSNEKSVAAIAGRVRSVLAFGEDHPYGEFTTEETLNNVSLDDIKTFHSNYFRPNNAYLVVVGDVNTKDVKKLVKKNFGKWKKGIVPAASFEKPENAYTTEIDFVNMDNAVQSEVAVQNTFDLTQKDPDYFPALIANKILGGGGEARLFLNLREDKGYTYGSYSNFNADRKTVSRFSATASVRNAVTDSSVVELLKEIDKIGSTPVSDEELKNAKAKYTGDFVLALESPQTIARYALNIERAGLPKDFYKTYLSKIDGVSKNEVQRVAKELFKGENAQIVVAGKASEVLDNLQKVEFNGKKVPVKFFDTYGKATTKPEISRPIPADVNVQSVLNDYINAIGGRAKLDAVNSVLIIAETSIQGNTLNLELKRTVKEQFVRDLSFGGNSMQKQVLDGNNGYVLNRGQRRDLEGDDLERMREESSPFPEVNWLNGGATLEKIEPINGDNAYVLKIGENKKVYYSTTTGLKIKEVTTQEAQGQTRESAIEYKNYKGVNGIQFPSIISQSLGTQSFDFEVTEIKVNEGVSDADFD